MPPTVMVGFETQNYMYMSNCQALKRIPIDLHAAIYFLKLTFSSTSYVSNDYY